MGDSFNSILANATPWLIAAAVLLVAIWGIFKLPSLILDVFPFRAPKAGRHRPTQPLDENVQFTVYRPRAVEPELWYSLLAYAHLSERRPDAPKSAPHPKAEVERKAQEALGERLPAYSDTATDSRQAIPQEGILIFVPVIEGVEFLPERHMILWEGPVHELTFKMKAQRELEGLTGRGYLNVYLGIFLVAEIPLSILIDTHKAREYVEASSELEDTVSPYRKIFASYSHADELVVMQFEQLVEAFGDKYLRDVRDIRAGEAWNKRLEELIREADIFQLFWSKRSMHSKFVRDEWEYALSLKRLNFIRPTFWEEPMPRDEEEGLPPEALLSLQFKRVPNYEQSPSADRSFPETTWVGSRPVSVRPSRSYHGKIAALLVLITFAATVRILLPDVFLRSRSAANEASAIGSLRAISTAEATYSVVVKGNRYGTLTDLLSSALIDSQLAEGKKSGYIFTVRISPPGKGDPKFEATAEPIATGIFGTGNSSFYTDERAIIYRKAGGKAGSREDPGSPFE